MVSSTLIIAVAVAGGAALLIALVVIVYCCWSARRGRQQHRIKPGADQVRFASSAEQEHETESRSRKLTVSEPPAHFQDRERAYSATVKPSNSVKRPKVEESEVLEAMYQQLDLTGTSNRLKYIPVDRLSLSGGERAHAEPLFLQMNISSGSYFAVVDLETALASKCDIFKSVPDEADNASSRDDQEDVYANAKSIVQSLLISSDQLKLGKVLGSGAFGDVVQATWKASSGDEITVAVKTIKVASTEMQDVSNANFVKEMTTMAQLSHPNIVRVLALTTDLPPRLVLEYIQGGSLHAWMSALPRSLPLHMMLMMADQVAQGLGYLSRHSVVHRDVAARNVLIRFDTPTRFVCKLSDFGLSRVFEDVTYVAKKSIPIPVRWTALEGLFFSRYSEKSDVWSFGVLMWEISTCCRIFPYDEHDDDIAVVQLIENGLRLPCPTSLPSFVYDIMVSCWHDNPDLRPSFSQLSEKLPVMVKDALRGGPELLAPPSTFPTIKVDDVTSRSGLPRESYQVIPPEIKVKWRKQYTKTMQRKPDSTDILAATAQVGNENAIPQSQRPLYSQVRKGSIHAKTEQQQQEKPSPTPLGFGRASANAWLKSFHEGESNTDEAGTVLTTVAADSKTNGESSQQQDISRSGSKAAIEASKVLSDSILPTLSNNELDNIRQWSQKVVPRSQAEAILNKTPNGTGLYMIRRGKEANEFVLSVRGCLAIQHYRIKGAAGSDQADSGSEAVSLIDSTNGDKLFSSLAHLAAFYKVLSPSALGGLIAKLTECVPFANNN